MLNILLPLLIMATSHGLRCINFYGLETELHKPVCSWTHPPTYYLDILKKSMGVDSVRIPFSYQLISCDMDIQNLDNMITEVSRLDMTIILDFHRVYSSHQSPAPNAEISIDAFIDAWRFVLARYSGNPSVRGVSLFNEYQSDDVGTLSTLTTLVVNSLESEFPGRFHYYLGGTAWGTAIAGLDYRNLTTTNWSYEVHAYGFHNLTDDQWRQKLGPKTNRSIFVGEWGFNSNEQEYARNTIKLFQTEGIKDICFWTIAHSKDTGGLWYDDCETVDQAKVALFKSAFISPPLLQCLRGKKY